MRMLQSKKRKFTDKNISPNLRPNVIICVFIVLATLTVYGQTRTHDFIGYDDDKYVTENIYVNQGLSEETVIWSFRSTHASNWHPLTWLSHMLDVELFGMDPGGHHMTSVFFHLVNSLLIFFLFQRMTGQVWRSGIVAILFAIHPLHVESVAWASERKDLLSTFFGLLAVWSYVSYIQQPGIARYFGAIGFFSMSLLAKPMLVTLPFLLLLLDFWPLKRINLSPIRDPKVQAGHRFALLRLVYEKIPLFVLAGLSCAVTVLVQSKGEAVGFLEVNPFTMRVANAFVSYLKYIQKMIWPYDLAILYPYPEVIAVWQVFSACAVLGCITFLTIRYRKRFPWIFVGWFWFIGTLVPVIGLVQVGVQAMADRYTYVPLVGLFVILSWGAVQLMKNWRYQKIILSVASAVLCFMLITSARAQVSHWKNSITLFERALRVTADNYVIHNNLGFELAMLGRVDEAIRHYRAALRINPEFELCHINLGSALFSQGKQAESFAYYQSVLKAKPDFAGVHHNLGVLLLRVGGTEEAVAHFQEALRLKPDYAEVYNSLGAALVSQGEVQEAMANFRQAIRIKPDLVVAKTNLKNLSAVYEGNRNPKVKLDFQ